MAKKKPAAKVGDVVAITFDDHVQGSDDVSEYTVYGRVALATQKAYTVDSWAMSDPARDREADRENITTFTILRGVISEVVILKKA